MLSASQLGITVASLGLGWVAEESIGHVFEQWFALLPFPIEESLRVSIGAIVALLLATYLHVVFGELVPRAAALQHPEICRQVARAAAAVLRVDRVARSRRSSTRRPTACCACSG